MLGEIIDFIYERKFIIALILIALFFISIAVYVYFNNIKPGLNKQFVENRESYCKKARPVINEFKSKIENKTFNNNRVIVREVDCETDSGTADKFKIEGYPTIKLVTEDGTVYDYDARPNVETLMQFLNEVL
jgi:thiol-disulfide isomerase/thioredoxin